MKHFLDPCLKNIGVETSNRNPSERKFNLINTLGKFVLALILLVGIQTNNFAQVTACDTPVVSDSTGVAPTDCDMTASFPAKSGNVWEFTIDPAKTYTFEVCADGFTPYADLWNNLGGGIIPADLIDVTGVANADGCATLTYESTGAMPCRSDDDLVYLALYSHSCNADWKDLTINVSCVCCKITCAPDVHVSASRNRCRAEAFTIPVPTVTGPCDATTISYTMDPALNRVPVPGPGTPIDITTTSELVVAQGVRVGAYVLTWTATDCAGSTYQCEQKIIVEPIMVCNDNVNVTLGAGCWVDLTPDMVLEAPCTNDNNYTVCIKGNAPGDKRIIEPGVYEVTIKYTPAAGPTAPFYGVSCWGYVTVVDQSGPSCEIPLEEREEHISCGEEVPCAEPVFDDCTGVESNTMFEYTFGNCGDLSDLLLDRDTTIDGILIPQVDLSDPEVIAFTAVGIAFTIDHVIVKSWQAVDVNGYVSNSCSQYIYVWRPSTIFAPFPNIEVECGSDIEPDDLAALDPRYVPYYSNPKFDGSTACEDNPFIITDVDEDCDPEFLPIVGDHAACKYSVVYEDVPLADLCGETIKVIRKWTVVDWCTGLIENRIDGATQVIKTVDTIAPEWDDCPEEGDDGYDEDSAIELNTSNSAEGQCYFYGTLNHPVASDDCSEPLTYKAELFNEDGDFIRTLPDLSLPVELPTGIHQIDFYATDECTNVSDTCTVYYNVSDDDKPIAICDESTTISLSNLINGNAQICASSINSGSYDNCGIVSMMLKRMGDDDSTFAPCMEVNCADVGDPIMVVFRVLDAAGNYNECMVEVEVQDKIGPFITCPDPVEIDCTQDYKDLTLTGDVIADATEATGINGYAFDNCVLDSITYIDDVELDCGSGSVIRTWSAWSNGRSSSCDQIITVVPDNAFFVQFPQDVLLTTCPSSDDIGDVGEVIITGETCAQIAISSVDQKFDIVDGGCYKIYRTFTIVNWCVYDHLNDDNTDTGIMFDADNNKFSDDGDGYFRYVQTIKVSDEEAPVFDDCPVETQVVEITAGDTCEGEVDFTLTATDNCTSELEYEWRVDEGSDGTYDEFGFDNNVVGFFTMGIHTATVYADDGCGNRESCTFTFEIKDKKAPAVGCHRLSTDLMDDGTGSVTIWAIDIIEESLVYDNCTDFDDLIITAVKATDSDQQTPPTTTSVVYNCDDLLTDLDGNPVPTEVLTEVWITDAAGNFSFCSIFVLITDHQDSCPQVTTGDGSAAINGRIYDEQDQDVENVMVEITSTSEPYNPFLTTNNGSYSFPGLSMNNSYTVQPEKDMLPLNGVTTYDLVLMSQHIIGTQPITSPYKKIAADINNDGDITTFDMVQLRQLILFVITDFPANKSWRFIEADFVFPDPSNPFATAFPEVINIASLSHDALADFVGVKIGDISGNAVPNTLLGAEDRSQNSITLSTDELSFEAGDRVSVPVKAIGVEAISGLQYTLMFDNEVLDFTDVDANELEGLTASNFGYTLLDEGIITSSWNVSEGSNELSEGTLYTLNFVAKKAGTLNDVIDINSRYTAAEAFDSEQVYDVEFIIETIGANQIATDFELFQNQPNPFRQHTTIGFNLPEATAASIKIMNVAGKELVSYTNDYAKGYNEITIDLEDLSVNGVLYYQIETSSHMASKKMIVLE